MSAGQTGISIGHYQTVIRLVNASVSSLSHQRHIELAAETYSKRVRVFAMNKNLGIFLTYGIYCLEISLKRGHPSRSFKSHVMASLRFLCQVYRKQR